MADIQNNHINNMNYLNFQYQNKMFINQQNFLNDMNNIQYQYLCLLYFFNSYNMVILDRQDQEKLDEFLRTFSRMLFFTI